MLADGRSAEARRLLETMGEPALQTSAAQCLLAQARLGCGSLDDALDGVTKAAALDPDGEWPPRLRSLVLERMGRHQQAIAAAEVAVERAPDLWLTHARLAEAITSDPAAVQTEHRNVTALSAARHAIRLAPDQPEAYVVLAGVHARRGEWEAMAAAQAAALARRPRDAGLHNDLALGRLRLKHAVPAAEGFALAAELDPQGPGRWNLGVVLHQTFDRRIRRVGLIVSIDWLAAAGPAGGPPRFWAVLAVLSIGVMVLAPIAGFVGAVAPLCRRAMAVAVLRDSLLTVQAGALVVSWLLFLTAFAMSGAAAGGAIFAANSCCLVSVVLACGRARHGRAATPSAVYRTGGSPFDGAVPAC